MVQMIEGSLSTQNILKARRKQKANKPKISSKTPKRSKARSKTGR
jgi:hypothetical protein